MHEAADRLATGVALGPDAALDALRWHWGDAYDIGRDDGVWWFRRRDGLGGQQTASRPDTLRTAIVADYTFRPVRRETAAAVEERRDRYEAMGVRIWHDPGGWHARWPVNKTHTGLSHPDHLTGLGGLLPPWAQELTRTCRRYTFTTTQVNQGRSVMARRISGTGPDVVITRSQDEMLTALGLKPDKASQ